MQVGWFVFGEIKANCKDLIANAVGSVSVTINGRAVAVLFLKMIFLKSGRSYGSFSRMKRVQLKWMVKYGLW